MSFTWIPFYKELADKLLVYRARQAELLALLNELKSGGVPVISLVDKDKNGKNIPLAVMDPFSFFATFNRRITDKNRKLILAAIKTKLHVEAAVPSDFDGIPVMNPLKSRFFPFEGDRKDGDIDALWDLAGAVVQKATDEFEPTLIDRCLSFKSTSITNLSMGMYWMRPATYIALDKRNCDLLDRQGISHSAGDGSSYLAFLKNAQNAINKAPFEFSLQAYQDTGSVKYWVFQSNPKRYDIVGALRDGKVKSWDIKTHKGDIKKGDRVIVWVTGKEAGCHALCEIISDLLEPKVFEDDGYYKQAPVAGPFNYVEIEVVTDLHDIPINKDEVAATPALSKLNVGHQGTVFTATSAQYQAIEKLAEAKLSAGVNGRAYWLYAPGPKAKYWDQCWENGEMVIGFADLTDLSTFQDKEDIVKALQKAKKVKSSFSNDALAAWQFVHEVKLGDIIIVKGGTTTYLGYGVVTGEYRFDKGRDGYRNVRDVAWQKKGEWLESAWPIVQKTLTDITKYPDYVNKLKNMIGIEEPPGSSIDLPSKNVILYGPPGTGKTYALRTKYMEYFTDHQSAKSPEEYADELVASMAWWEVIAVVMLDLGQAKVADILNHALLQARIRRSENRNPRAAVWAHMQMHTKRDCQHVAYSKRYEPLLFEKSDKSVWSIDKEAAHTEVPELSDKLKAFKEYKAKDATVIRRYSFM